VQAAGIDADLSTIDQADEPDIRCSISGRKTGYELTAATDGTFEKQAQVESSEELWLSAKGLWFSADIVCTTFAKVWRKYRYDLPVELIVHEGTAPLPPVSTWIDQLEMMLRSHFEGSGFRRLWVVDPWKPEILYCWPKLECELQVGR
jgi:hypothetical protein